jgi:hypothetical protein
MFVSDLQQASGFHPILRYPPPIKLTTTTEILLKVVETPQTNQPIHLTHNLVNE